MATAAFIHHALVSDWGEVVLNVRDVRTTVWKWKFKAPQPLMHHHKLRIEIKKRISL